MSEKWRAEFWVMADYFLSQRADTEDEAREWVYAQIGELSSGEEYGYRISRVVEVKHNVVKE